MAAVTTVEHVLSVLGIKPSPQAQQAYASAEAAVAKSCRWPATDAAGEEHDAPADLVQAVVLRTARYLARRNSPEGVVGVNEFGPVRISTVDRDIEDLEAPWRPVVFG